MKRDRLQKGFSLTEVLLAVATLAIGMLFVGGTFVLGVVYSTRATEQTIAAVAAEEAVTKIRLYRLDPNDPNQALRSTGQTPYVRDQKRSAIPAGEFRYPSADVLERQYTWSALCRWADPNMDSRLVQVTVFVCRNLGVDAQLPERLDVLGVSGAAGDEMQFAGSDSVRRLYDRSVLVDDATGQIYRVAQVNLPQADRVKLDRPWQGGSAGAVWAVPRPPAGGRNPCISVFQTEVRMPDPAGRVR
jgi:prepilin-type N-terminal cleavage/methylation domain-containing protein